MKSIEEVSEDALEAVQNAISALIVHSKVIRHRGTQEEYEEAINAEFNARRALSSLTKLERGRARPPCMCKAQGE